VVWTVMIKCAACTPRQEKQTVGQWGSFMEITDSAALNAFVIFTENVPSFGEHKRSDKNSWRNWPLLWSFHMHVRDSKCSKHRKMWNRSFAVAAIYQHPHQLQAPPSIIQHSARGATFVPDQRTRKPNSSVMSATTLCAKIMANGCATNARSKS